MHPQSLSDETCCACGGSRSDDIDVSGEVKQQHAPAFSPTISTATTNVADAIKRNVLLLGNVC
jgi:hypothetical protein